MISIEDISKHMPEIFEVSELSDESIYSKIRLTAIEMATNAGLLKREYEIGLQDCVTDYLLDECDDVEIQYLDKAFLESDCGKAICIPIIRSDTCSEVERCLTSCDEGQMSQASVGFLLSNLIRFSSNVQGLSEKKLRIIATVAPTFNSCELDDEFASRWRLPLMYGTIARAYLASSLASSTPMADKYQRMYQAELTRSFITSTQRGVRGGIHVRTGRFI